MNSLGLNRFSARRVVATDGELKARTVTQFHDRLNRTFPETASTHDVVPVYYVKAPATISLALAEYSSIKTINGKFSSVAFFA